MQRKTRRASRNLRTGVDPTGEEPGRPREKGAWAGKAGQQLSVPEMKGSVQERSGGVDIGGHWRQVDEDTKTRKLGLRRGGIPAILNRQIVL